MLVPFDFSLVRLLFPPLSNDRADRYAPDFVRRGEGDRGAQPHSQGGLRRLLGAGACVRATSLLYARCDFSSLSPARCCTRTRKTMGFARWHV